MVTDSINDEAVFRTAPATLGLLNMTPGTTLSTEIFVTNQLTQVITNKDRGAVTARTPSVIALGFF